jgi:hypothetical protein
MKREQAQVLAGALALTLAVGLVTGFLPTPANADTPSPALQVTPADHLREGQAVRVAATGIAHATYTVYECAQFFESPLLTSTCNVLGSLTAANGVASKVVRVTENVGAPVALPQGTFDDTCQLLLTGCLLLIGAHVTADQDGVLSGFDAQAGIRFRPSLSTPTAAFPLSDGQVVPVVVRPPRHLRGPLRIAQCVAFGTISCQDAVVFAPPRAHRRFGTVVVFVRVTSDVNGTFCRDSPPGGGLCFLIAGTGDVGAPSGHLFGETMISVAAR